MHIVQMYHIGVQFFNGAYQPSGRPAGTASVRIQQQAPQNVHVLLEHRGETYLLQLAWTGIACPRRHIHIPACGSGPQTYLLRNAPDGA